MAMATPLTTIANKCDIPKGIEQAFLTLANRGPHGSMRRPSTCLRPDQRSQLVFGLKVYEDISVKATATMKLYLRSQLFKAMVPSAIFM